MEGVSPLIINKQDAYGLLFWRSTRYANRTMMYKGEFADDVVLLAWLTEAACAAIKGYVEVTSSLGLTVSSTKTKFMVIGCAVFEEDWQHLSLLWMRVWLSVLITFCILDQWLWPRTIYHAEIDVRIAKASTAFGALRNSVFCDHHFMCADQAACVLSTLLYGSECWAPLYRHLRKLDNFHHRYIRMPLEITKKHHWKDHNYIISCVRNKPQPIMLKFLPIMLLSTTQKSYLLLCS